jgi:hypothetical protein
MIGVRYSMDIIPASGSPLVDYRGVTDKMGLPISESIFFAPTSVSDLFGVRNNGSSTYFAGISALTSIYLSILSTPGDISSWFGPSDSWLRTLVSCVFP